ncbi:PIN domain-like protein [Dipodascopsis tothii]|uniref:PIN domain-like protein n=1 Tax=Dipodascopsis tothii TaxID=44089 RepID=UPI0034CF2F15
MGISGLLQVLKSIQEPTHVRHFSGQVVGVDGYVWLHRGAIACASELALGKSTQRYVDFAMKRVRMLQNYGVKPYVVFDGAYLPSKKKTEIDRSQSRERARRQGMEFHAAGYTRKAYEMFQKSIDITPTMAWQLIKALRLANIPYVVAPYEADAQLAYLQKCNIISAILSEDSDLLIFGANCLLTKLTDAGDCIAIRRERFRECTDLNLRTFTDAQLRQMAILAGCDYTPGIPQIGLKKAHMYLTKYTDAHRALRHMRIEGKVKVPIDFEHELERADRTFCHQRVFCPLANRVVMWNDYDGEVSAEMDNYIGSDIPTDLAVAIARGELDPNTREPIPDSPSRAFKHKSFPSPSGSPSPRNTLAGFFKPAVRPALSDVTTAATNAVAESPSPNPLKRTLSEPGHETASAVAKKTFLLGARGARSQSISGGTKGISKFFFKTAQLGPRASPVAAAQQDPAATVIRPAAAPARVASPPRSPPALRQQPSHPAAVPSQSETRQSPLAAKARLAQFAADASPAPTAPAAASALADTAVELWTAAEEAMMRTPLVQEMHAPADENQPPRTPVARARLGGGRRTPQSRTVSSPVGLDAAFPRPTFGCALDRFKNIE